MQRFHQLIFWKKTSLNIPEKFQTPEESSCKSNIEKVIIKSSTGNPRTEQDWSGQLLRSRIVWWPKSCSFAASYLVTVCLRSLRRLWNLCMEFISLDKSWELCAISPTSQTIGNKRFPVKHYKIFKIHNPTERNYPQFLFYWTEGGLKNLSSLKKMRIWRWEKKGKAWEESSWVVTK